MFRAPTPPAVLIGALGLLLAGCLHDRRSAPVAADLYHGFTRVDPDGEQLIEDSYLLVRDGRILRSGTGTPPSVTGVAVDLHGHYALPGFIDAHAHITAGPHRIELRDGVPAVTIESVEAITRHNARIALAFGVTTVRNPGGDPQANAEYDAHVADGRWIGPEALHAGAVIQPPPFTGKAFAYPRTAAQWDAEAARQANLGMRYFKLYTDLSREELGLGIAAAHSHGLKAIAHLNAVSWTDAVRLGIDGLEHTLPTSGDLLEPAQRAEYLAEQGPDTRYLYRWFELVDLDGPLIGELVAELARRQVIVNTTLVVNELAYNADALDTVLPPADRVHVHPDNLAAMLTFLAAGTMSAEDHRRARAVMPKVFAFVRRLHAAGVPLSIGTDGNGGGPAYARELALHVEAGLPTWEVLRMATSTAAERLGVADHTGRLVEGLDADIVFLRGNPVASIGHVRDVALTVSNGVPYRFEELAGDGVPAG